MDMDLLRRKDNIRNSFAMRRCDNMAKCEQNIPHIAWVNLISFARLIFIL
jgi:hypothetical protein